MNLSRRKFVAGSVGGMIALAGCSSSGENGTPTGTESGTQGAMNPESDTPMEESSDESTESWEVTRWSNPNTEIRARMSGEVSEDGSVFTISFDLRRSIDFMWVDVVSNDDEPEGGWFTDASDVPVGFLSDYGATEGSVLLKGDIGQGGVGTEAGINLETTDDATVVVMGGKSGDTVMDDPSVLNVYSLSKG